MQRGDYVLIHDREAVIRYSYRDLYGEGSDQQYRVAFLRKKQADGWYEEMTYSHQWYDEADLALIGSLTEDETKKAETLQNESYEIDQYQAQFHFTLAERRVFAALVMRFYELKQAQRYDKSDEVRKELLQWQRGLGDQDFIEMAETGKFILQPFLRDNFRRGNDGRS